MKTYSLKRIFLSVLFLFASLQVLGREVTLLEIISEPEGNKKHFLTFNLDKEGDVLKINRKSSGSNQSFTVDQLNEKGVILYKTEGRDVIKLMSNSMDRIYGGHIIMTFLTNGITMTYDELDFEIVRKGDRWEALTLKGRKINRLTLISRKILGKVIGIKKILID
jgi:hypothetical protein